MGKKNPAQRTKGNAKASSSTRAAELLSASGAPAYSFGFGGGTTAAAVNSASSTGNDAPSAATSIVPTAASVPFAVVATSSSSLEDGDASNSAAFAAHLSGDVKLLLKKMTKKDTITKCKALNEFISLLEDDGEDRETTRYDGKGTDSKIHDDCDEDILDRDDNDDETQRAPKRMSADDVKSLVPFWPRIYNALSMDSDRKVRELTQRAMLQLVKPERKKLLAPHIKTFLGAWMIALVDSYPPAASAASRAFDAAFSKAKQLEAVRYCRKEILFYLKDILLDQSPTTLSDPKATPKDEMEAKYERVVAASLSALKTLVEMVVGDDYEQEVDAEVSTAGDGGGGGVTLVKSDRATSLSSSKEKKSIDSSLDAELENLLSNKKMVKLSVHSNPIIRAAWYFLVAAVCAKRPRLFVDAEGDSDDGAVGDGKMAASFASSVLNRFEETDPGVVGAFWNAVMAVLKVVPDPWSHASLRKSVLPKLFLLLRSGCGGNAVVVGPHIVVLVSKMPADVVGFGGARDEEGSPASAFYKEISSAVIEALEKGATTFQSPSESGALLLCLAECLQFLLASSYSGVAQNSSTSSEGGSCSNDGDDIARIKRIPLVRQLLSLLEISLNHKSSKQIFSASFFRVFGNILTKIEKEETERKRSGNGGGAEVTDEDSTDTSNCGEEAAKETSENRLSAIFWNGFRNLVRSIVGSGDLNAVDKLVGILRHPKTTGDSSAKKVGFASEICSLRRSSTSPSASKPPLFKTRMLNELKRDLYLSLENQPTIPLLNVFCRLCDGDSNLEFVERVLGEREQQLGRVDDDVTERTNLGTNAGPFFLRVLTMIWRPLKSRFADQDVKVDVKLSLTRLLRNLVFDFHEEIPIATLQAAVETVNEPLFYQVVLEGVSDCFEREMGDDYLNQLDSWRAGSTVSAYAVRAFELALSDESSFQKEEMRAFASYLVHRCSMGRDVVRGVIQLLRDGLEKMWSDSKVSLETSTEAILLTFAAAMFQRHGVPWDERASRASIEHEQRDSRDLHLLIWGRCVDERIRRWISGETCSANFHLLDEANESALSNAEDEAPFHLEHVAAMGEIARDRLFGSNNSFLVRHECDVITFLSEISSHLTGAGGIQSVHPSLCKMAVFLQSIFSDSSSDAAAALGKQFWLPQAISSNAVWVDGPLASLLSANDSLSGESTAEIANYLSKLSVLAQILLRLDLSLVDLALTHPVSEPIFSQLAEISLILNLLSAAPPTSKPHLHHQQQQPQQRPHDEALIVPAEEVRDGEGFVSHLKKVFTEVLERLRPKSESKTSDVWVRANEIVGFTMEKVGVDDDGDLVLSRYRKICALSFVSFLKGQTSTVNYTITYPLLQASESFPDEVKETCLGLCLENSEAADMDLLKIMFDRLRSLLKTSCDAEGDFDEMGSLLFGVHRVASKMASLNRSCAEEIAELLNEVVKKKPKAFVENLIDCADLDDVSWPVAQFNVTFMNLITLLLHDRTHSTRLNSNTWEFILCSCLGWTQTVSESISRVSPAEVRCSGSVDPLKTLAFTKGCCDLVSAVSSTFCIRCRPVANQSQPGEDSWLTLSTIGDAAAETADLASSSSAAKEWNQSFAESVFSVLLSVFVQFADSTAEFLSVPSEAANFSASALCRSVGVASVAASFRSALECCVPDDVILSEDVEIEAKLLVDDFATWKSMSPHLQSLFNRLTAHLVNPLVDIQLLAFHLLSRLLPSVAKSAEEDYARESARREREADASAETRLSTSDEGWRPPAGLSDLFESAQVAFEYLVEGLYVGQTLSIDADDDDYDAHTYVLSYMLAWNALRRLLECATPELRAQYTISMRDKIPTVLRHLLFLLPDCLIEGGGVSPRPQWRIDMVSRLRLGAILDTRSKDDVSFMLGNQDPVLPPRVNAASIAETTHIGANFYISGYGQGRDKQSGVGAVLFAKPSSSNVLRSLHGLAGATFIGTFRDLPASVRQWWTDADKKTTALVERISSLHISPVLTARELNSVEDDQAHTTASALENITVKVLPQSREVVATYMMDEITLELLIKVPANFPLGQIVVECGRRVGELKEQKRWMMQLTTFLRHQNGSIVDGIAMWKKNIDKPFEGVDPCMVCFSVLHSSNYQLPKLTCKACKKKFHSVCLYKWFSTSNNSSCPLCRSLF